MPLMIVGVWVTADSEWRSYLPAMLSGLVAAGLVVAAIGMGLRRSRWAYPAIIAAFAVAAVEGHFVGLWWTHR